MTVVSGRLVRPARRLVFQPAGVLVTGEMPAGKLERIGRLRLAPGQPAMGAPVVGTVMGSSSANRLPQGSDLGRERRFWVVMLGREVATP